MDQICCSYYMPASGSVFAHDVPWFRAVRVTVVLSVESPAKMARCRLLQARHFKVGM